jgi:cytochrome c peroxidase
MKPIINCSDPMAHTLPLPLQSAESNIVNGHASLPASPSTTDPDASTGSASDPGGFGRFAATRRKTTTVGGVVLSLCVALSSHAADPHPAPTKAIPVAARTREPIRPVPQSLPLDANKVALGRKLFHEPMLSRDNTVSCASCHDLRKGGTDRRSHSLGIKQAEGPINAPTVFNSGFHIKQFWDGRADSLEDQVDGPLQADREMGGVWEDVLVKLRGLPAYTAAFQQVYPDGVQRKNVKNAIAEFERSLITPNAPFDRYLRGDDTALTADEKEGYRKFKLYGCITCHQGVNVGGNIFQPFGVMGDYFADRGNVTKADLGRFNVTGNEEDKFVFKVASLRNIAVTGPYFHDGSAGTLEEAVAVMAKYQLGRELPPKDLDQIVRFLKSLTGEYEGKPLQ